MCRFNRSYLYMLLLQLFPFLLIGQGPSITADPSLSILPPSPTAAALAKYAEFPVDYYSGTPQISLPLHNLVGRGIAVPISLSYHAGGVKVDEVSSIAGLGWSLNAGGVVTRTIRGEADESIDGFMERGDQVPTSSDITTDLTELKHFASSAGTTPWDGQPDVFHFNFGGYSGKFVFEDETTIHLIPYQDLKITYNKTTSGITDFLIVTPDGIEYTFGTSSATEKSESSNYAVGVSNGCRAKEYGTTFPTAWFLKTIYHPGTKDSITFNYSPKTVTYDLSYNESYRYPNGILPSACMGQHSLTKCVTKKEDTGVSLTSIQSAQGSVEFVYASRTDVIGDQRLTDIRVKGQQGDLLKYYKLVQNFITSSGNTPSTDSYSNVRMYLDELEEYASDDTFINEHKFSYHNRTALPPRLSYQQDHWGFYNDNPVNATIPVDIYTQLAVEGYFPGFQNADRSPSPTKSQYGILNQITYPTGGTVSYEFEGNEVPICDDMEIEEMRDTSISVLYQGGSASTVIAPFTIPTTQEVSVDLRVFKIGVMSNGAYVEIRPQGGGSPVYGRNDYEDVAITPACFEENNVMVTLTPGTYELVAYVATEDNNLTEGNICGFSDPTQEYAEISVHYVDVNTVYEENIPIGGIRVKKITYDDGDQDPSNEIVRLLEYDSDIGGCVQSTGIELGKKPKYKNQEMTIADDSGLCEYVYCPYVLLNSASLTSLANHSGSIVGYREVWEKHGPNAENGYNYYKYEPIIDGSSQLGPNQYDYFLSTPTVDYGYKSGKLIEQKAYHANDQLVSEQLNDYELYETVNQHNIKAIFARQLFQLPCTPTNPNDEIEEYAIEWYDVVSQWVYLKGTTTRIYASDGSGNFTETVTTYDYDLPNGRFAMPTAITMTNSDGKETKNIFLYAHDKSGAEYTALVDQNIIGTPVETTKEVAGVQIDGIRTDFTLLGGYPYPTASHRYEGTWISGTFSATGSAGGWEKQWDINTYDLTLGLPTQFTRNGWSNPEDYTWTSEGFLQQKTFIDYVQAYEYHADQPLIARVTDIDDQYIDYEYDHVQRLKTAFARPKTPTGTRPANPAAGDYHVVTDYVYEYHTPGSSHPLNYVETTTTFTLATGSALTTQKVRQYLDGLGRPIAEILVGYSPNNKDVVTITEYDAQGRVTKVYEPFESSHSDGTFVAAPLNQPYTETAYHSSPLNRVKSVKPPDWNYPRLFDYGSNTATITVNGTNYTAGALTFESVTDGNGNTTTTYQDKKGRTIQQSRPLSAITQYEYDDKDRLTLVIPPGASPTDANLVYQYTYDGADNVLTKKIPDMDATISYVYDARDLPIYTQDPEMANDNRWLQTKYDNYGRPTQTGFTNNSGVPTGLATFDELLTEQIYYGQGVAIGKEGKLKEQYTKVLGTTNDWLKSFQDYDVFGRPNQILANHHLDLPAYDIASAANNAEVTTFTYDYADNVLTEERIHRYNSQDTYLMTKNDYDDEGRLTDSWFDVGSTPLTPTTKVANYQYSVKDELLQKNLGLISGSNYLQQVDFTYNAQRWLTAINPTLSGTDLFRLELKYDNPDDLPGTESPDYVGNISQITWESKGDIPRAYDFNYDSLDRIVKASYFEYASGAWSAASNDYQTDYTYDVRGNIETLLRRGRYEDNGTSQIGYIDWLTYAYTPNTNRLQSIAETVSTPANIEGFNPGAGTGNYSYDANGNLTLDPYKSMDMQYNFLNLPDRVEKDAANYIEWIYDAAGNKLQKKVNGQSSGSLQVGGNPITEGQYEADEITVTGTVAANTEVVLQATQGIEINGPFETELNAKFTAETVDSISGVYTKARDYIGGIEYLDGEIEAIYFSEGRIYYLNGVPRYEYYLKDHLGNTRMVFTEDGADADSDPDVLQENHYYPFGLAMRGDWEDVVGTENAYLYNGIERNEDHGLNWDIAVFRSYDPAIGRWCQVDPQAEKYYSISPFNGMGNNPLILVDPLGDTTRLYSTSGELLGTIDDSHENQEHFLTAEQLSDFNGLRSIVGNSTNNLLGTFARALSEYYIGARTRSDLADLAARGEADGVEAYGVAVISSSKELRVVDKSSSLSIKRGAKKGSCNNCRSEAFVSVMADAITPGINKPIAFDAHTHGDYSLDYKFRNAPANSGPGSSYSTLGQPSSGDLRGTGLQRAIGFGPGVVSTKYGYTIFSHRQRNYRYINVGQIFNYSGGLLKDRNKL